MGCLTIFPPLALLASTEAGAWHNGPARICLPFPSGLRFKPSFPITFLTTHSAHSAPLSEIPQRQPSTGALEKTTTTPVQSLLTMAARGR